jgi:hypothetical protein
MNRCSDQATDASGFVEHRVRLLRGSVRQKFRPCCISAGETATLRHTIVNNDAVRHQVDASLTSGDEDLLLSNDGKPMGMPTWLHPVLKNYLFGRRVRSRHPTALTHQASSRSLSRDSYVKIETVLDTVDGAVPLMVINLRLL